MSDTFPFNASGTLSYNDTIVVDGAPDIASKGEIPTDKLTRMIALCVITVVTIVGNVLVYAWLALHRSDKARINQYVWALATADLTVALFPLLFNIALPRDHPWKAGDALCRIRMLLESVALMASSNMVVAIAVDRFYSVMYPLKKALSERVVILVSWGLAFLFSIPNLHVFRTYTTENGTEAYCRSMFRDRPKYVQQIYFSYVTLVVFLIPFIMICFTYFMIITRLFSEGKSSFKSSWKRSARWRTMKMTFVIIATYVLCNTPFFITELIIVYAGRNSVNPYVYAVFSVFVTSNSATNPFVFLYFTVCKRKKKRQPASENQTTMETQYTTAPNKITKSNRNSPAKM